MLLCHTTARRPENAKNRKINITMFSTSALCLTHHWNILVSVMVSERTRPTCPASKAKWERRRKSVYFSTPHTGPSVTLQRRLLYFLPIFILFYNSFLLRYSWFYNVVLVSGVQQNDSVTYIHVYSSQIHFHYRLLQDIEYNSLCYTVSPCGLSIL